MSGKSSVIDHIPVFGLTKCLTEKLAEKGGASKTEASILGTIFGAAASIIQTAAKGS